MPKLWAMTGPALHFLCITSGSRLTMKLWKPTFQSAMRGNCHLLKQHRKPKNICYFLPHAILNPNKLGKIRVVFDAAESHKGTSLNDQLVKSPNLQNSLLGVIMRFTLHTVPMIADIKQGLP